MQSNNKTPRYLEEFHPPARILMGAGPSNVNPRVLHAMTAPLLGHLDPDFIRVMDDVREMLRIVFQTTNVTTLPISGTGSAGMEAALVNILEPGDTVVVGINGYFADRISQIATRCGATVHIVNAPWGHPLDPKAMEAEVKKHPKVKVVAMVHAETSTGVQNPVAEIAQIAHRHGALALVDTVTSLGGIEVAIDRWGVDVCYSGTQKCLGCPPGLAPITFGPRAEEVLKSRKTPVQSWYLDVTLLRSYWSENRAYHHTAPISMIYGLREGLRVVLEEGLEARFQRHSRNAQALWAGLEALGLRLFAQEGVRLPTLTAVHIPDGVSDTQVRSALLRQYNIEIAGGLGPVAGKIWRIGLMGENAKPSNVVTLLSALEEILPKMGYEVAKGEGVAAAQRALAA
ncbi:MAG: alanine--glyoxylate aminotransferase family protein [Dehalococcoidia bacterium]|nr:alanine--glyoxylate aminotransferase family protein [Dehalococcoidia bacterium]